MSFPWLDFERSAAAILLLLCAAGVAGLWLLRPVWRWLCGPMFGYEMVRLARNGRTILLRVLFAVLVLAGIAILMPSASAPQSNDLAVFANRFSNAFLYLQAGIVFLLVPLYFGGALSSEKERGNHDFFMVTDLTSRELVLGKFAAHAVHMIGMLLAGLPVLAMTQVWGGVNLLHIVAGYAVVFITIFSMGGLAMMCSALQSRTTTAVACAYCLSFLFSVVGMCQPLWHLSSPFAFLARLDMQMAELDASLSSDIAPLDSAKAAVSQMRDSLALYGAVHGLVGTTCLAIASRNVRPRVQRYPERVVKLLAASIPATALEGTGFTLETLLRGKLPAIGNNPIAWKERYIGSSGAGFLFDVGWFYFYVVVAGTGLIRLLSIGSALYAEVSHGVTLALRAIVEFVFILLLIRLGFHASSTISREREQGTLETLLSLPLSTSSILGSKILGILLRRWNMFLGLAVVCGIAMITKVFHPLTPIWLIVAIAVHCVFAISLGIFLSTICRSTVRARIVWFAIMLFLTLGTALMAFASEGPDSYVWEAIGIGANAPLAIWWLMLRRLSDASIGGAIEVGLAFYALAAALLFFASRWKVARSGAGI